MTPRLVITPGDPRGIGPEVTVRALSRRVAVNRPVQALIIGDGAAIRRAAEALGLPEPEVLDPGDQGEPVEVRALRLAVEGVRSGRAQALVTGPIHKERLAARGFAYTGHTDFLGALLGVERPIMAFVGGKVRVVLVTVHVPLARVPQLVTTQAVLDTLRITHEALQRQLRLAQPRLLVCGLNPHAGDGGVLGREDLTVVAPAVEQARSEGIDAVGPISSEGAFRSAVTGAGDVVVAMYHDQGLAPLKALGAAGLGASVNWTLGLPLIRTSVDHGTADDIAGTGQADPSSMLAAIALAEELAAVHP